MSTAIQDVYLTLYGQKVDGIAVNIGQCVNWHLTLQEPTDLSPFSLLASNVVIALSTLDPRGLPLSPPKIARQATIVSIPDGTALAQWVSADTVPVVTVWAALTPYGLGSRVTNGGNLYQCVTAGSSASSGGPSGTGSNIADGSVTWSFTGVGTSLPPFAPGVYGLEVWLTDGSGNRFASMPVGNIKLAPASYLPGGSITPLPAQVPLAEGPPGLGLTVEPVRTSNVTAAILQLLPCDPTSGSFTVSLPAASAGAGLIVVYVQSGSSNTVTVAPAGFDTIAGVAGSVVLGAREKLSLYSDGISDWVVL